MARRLDVWPVGRAQPATLYAGTYGRGVLASPDGGAHWRTLNADLGSLFIAAVTIDPTRPTMLHAGTGSGVFGIERAVCVRRQLRRVWRSHRR